MAVAQKDLNRNLEFIIDGSEKIFVSQKDFNMWINYDIYGWLNKCS